MIWIYTGPILPAGTTMTNYHSRGYVALVDQIGNSVNRDAYSSEFSVGISIPIQTLGPNPARSFPIRLELNQFPVPSDDLGGNSL
jgi:hypothetical protein